MKNEFKIGNLKEAKKRLIEAGTERFTDLVRIAGLDPARHFRCTNLSGIDFSGDDLRGFDFSGARLRNCKFRKTRISGARFDKADLQGSNLKEAADWTGYVENWTKGVAPVSDLCLETLGIFQDAPFAPEMVVIPPGKFMMGAPENEKGRLDDEGPQHEVTISYPFAVGRFAVTCEQFRHFADTTNYQVPNKAYTYEGGKWEERGNRSFRNPGFEQSDTHPVVCVNWHDAQAYIKWLREVTGEPYRLLSEAEWEYVCRAGTTTPYWFGSSVSNSQANYNSHKGHTVPVDSFEPNAWGLYNVHGNVWEWCEDGWRGSYTGAPGDGSAWVDKGAGDSVSRILRGGSWYSEPEVLRSAIRVFSVVPASRNVDFGFRISRTLTP